MKQLVLSLFSGIGLLDHQFKKQGFVVVSAGDLITGQDIREFKSLPNKFDGIIGGSPCQDFSGLKRNKTNYSQLMLNEFKRIVIESNPDWWLLENVKGVPDLKIESYSHQRIDINQGWYDNYSRLRHIQFGSKTGLILDIPKGKMNPNCKPLATASDSRSFSELKHIQGLPDTYELSELHIQAKKRAVGNGVPVSIAKTLAIAVKYVTEPVNNNVTRQHHNIVTKPGAKIVTNRYKESVSLCRCGCYRKLYGRKQYYDSACRKRAQRKRDSAA